MAQFILKVLSSALAVTRTVSDTTASAAASTSPTLRVAVDASGNARLTAYTSQNPPSHSQVSTLVAQLVPCVSVYQCLTSDSTFTKLGYILGAKEASQPFYVANTGRFYVNLIGYRGGQNLANTSSIAVGTASLLVDITAGQALSSFSPPQRFRIAACVGEYAPDASYVHSNDSVGYFSTNTSPAYRPAISAYKVMAAVGQIGSTGTRQYSMNLMNAYDPATTTFADDMFSGGIVGRYDGLTPAETGFASGPQVYALDVGGGSLAAGTYSYVAIWIYRDKEGKAHYSRVSEPVTVITVGGASKVNVDVSVPGMCSTTGQLTLQVYRTTSGGTQYYRVGSKTITTTAGSPVGEGMMAAAFADVTTDAALQTNPLLFRQPGTAGTPLDRVSALSGAHIVRHKDRVFYCHENTVYYSSFDVDGEAPWFSPGLSFDVIGGKGPITGLASMDGVLVVFKRDSIFLVDGDGPPENGGAGNEYSAPRRVQCEFGCIEPRSIVSTPSGIMFQSNRGIELLNRGYNVSWIGQRVSTVSVLAYPYCGGSTFDRKTGRVYFAMGSAVAADGGLTYTSNGVVLVYDTVVDTWSRFFYTNTSAYGKAIQDVCFCNATSGTNVNDTVYLADHNNGAFYESESSGLDASGSFVPWTIATGWVHAQSMQDRIRVTDLFFLGRRLSGLNINCTYYFNYDRTTGTSIKTFDATATNISPVQLVFQPAKEQVQSMKFVLSSVTPSNPATLGSGQQVSINGITIRVAPRGGGPKLGVAQKG